MGYQFFGFISDFWIFWYSLSLPTPPTLDGNCSKEMLRIFLSWNVKVFLEESQTLFRTLVFTSVTDPQLVDVPSSSYFSSITFVFLKFIQLWLCFWVVFFFLLGEHLILRVHMDFSRRIQDFCQTMKTCLFFTLVLIQRLFLLRMGSPTHLKEQLFDTCW